jgi:hypothetical protein
MRLPVAAEGCIVQNCRRQNPPRLWSFDYPQTGGLLFPVERSTNRPFQMIATRCEPVGKTLNAIT